MSPFADHFGGVASAYASYRPRYPDGLFTGTDEQLAKIRMATGGF